MINFFLQRSCAAHVYPLPGPLLVLQNRSGEPGENRALRIEDGERVQHCCRTLIGENKKPKTFLFVNHQATGFRGLLAVERGRLKWAPERDCRFLGPDSHALVPLLFFFGIPVKGDVPLIDTSGAIMDSFFFCFGFRDSRLPRLCPLAMVPSCISMGCPNSPCRRLTPAVQPSSPAFRQPSPQW